MLKKVICIKPRHDYSWINQTEQENYANNLEIISNQIKGHRKISSMMRNKSYTLVGALGLTIESQNQEIASLTKKIFDLQSASYEFADLKMNQYSKEIKNIKEIISELYNNLGFDHNSLYLSLDYIPTIDQYSPWVHVVHMKLTLLYFCVSLLLNSDKNQMDEILPKTEKIMHDLLINNIPFAPCINNFIAYPTIVLLTLFPKSISTLLRLKIMTFITNTKSTPIQDIEKDKIHYIKKTLEVLFEFKELIPVSKIDTTDYALWEKNHLFSTDPDQMDYDYEDGPLFFSNNIDTLFKLLQRLLPL